MQCKLCNSERAVFYVGLEAKKYKIYKCLDCLNAFTYPQPIYNKYSDEDFHGQFTYTAVDQLPWQWRKSSYKQISLINKFIKKNGKILEVGCGQGIFLTKMKQYGYSVYGIEPSKRAAQSAIEKGVKTITGYYPESSFQDEKFDLIVVSHVLEHVENIKNFCVGLKRNLAENGYVLFTQTNYQGIIPRFLKEKWYAWVPEQHFWHFTPKGLSIYLKKNDFSIVQIKYSSLIHPINFMSLFSIIFPKNGDQFHLLVKKE